MSIPSPSPDGDDVVRTRHASPPAPLDSRAMHPAAAPGPPGLGGLLMVVGGALSVAGGLFIALGAQAVVSISPGAATLFLKGVPLIAGGALVVIGAAVRRALRRAYMQGVAAGRDGLAPPPTGGSVQPALHGKPRDR